MRVSINSILLAEELADKLVSFKARNKTKVEVGIDYKKEDVREREEWKELFLNFHKIIINQREI